MRTCGRFSNNAELLEIDENLRRYDLTAWEQSRHIERREALLKKKGQRAKASPGTNQHEVPLTVSGTKTTAELANEAGMSTATYKRRSAVGRDIAAETAEILNSITDLKTCDLPDSPKQLKLLSNVRR